MNCGGGDGIFTASPALTLSFCSALSFASRLASCSSPPRSGLSFISLHPSSSPMVCSFLMHAKTHNLAALLPYQKVAFLCLSERVFCSSESASNLSMPCCRGNCSPHSLTLYQVWQLKREVYKHFFSQALSQLPPISRTSRQTYAAACLLCCTSVVVAVANKYTGEGITFELRATVNNHAVNNTSDCKQKRHHNRVALIDSTVPSLTYQG